MLHVKTESPQIPGQRLLTTKVFLSTILIFLSTLSFAQTDSWTAKADFDGAARYFAAGFTIGTKVYIGTGTDESLDGKTDFWEYDPAGNTWTQKADFAGAARFGAVGFSINGKGYIALGAGDQGTDLFNDIWEYDATANTWTQKADFTGVARIGAAVFVVDNKAYVGTGQDASASALVDFWEFDPSGNSWTSKADFPGTARYFATGFAIGTKGYLGTGSDVNDQALGDFWEYDPSGNAWTQKADFDGAARSSAVGFAISTRGFIGTGSDASLFNDFWEYNPTTNAWTQKTDFNGSARVGAAAVAVGGKGYVGTGMNPASTKDFYEYTPSPILLDQTITFDALPAKTFGDGTFSLTATASSSLPVSYVSSNTSVATISGSTVTIVGAGSTTITASQAGDDTYNPAPSVDQTLTVAKADQIITFDALPAKGTGDASFALTATSSSSLPVSYSSSNPAVATISGATVTITGPGTTTITASQAGDVNYNAAPAVEQDLVVADNRASQTITFDALPSKTFGDDAFDLTATASSGLSVSYASSNTAVASISGSTLTITGAGSATITASQPGDGSFKPAQNVDQLLTVTKADQTPFFYIPPSLQFAGGLTFIGPYTSASLPVTVTSSDPNVATVTLEPNDSWKFIATGVGTTTVTISQAGNENYNPVMQSANMIVTKGDQSITFNALPAKTFGDAAFGLSAGTTSNLTVTFSSSDPTIADVTGGLLTIKKAGSVEITANQPGNENYNAASPVTRTLTITKADQAITFGPLDDKSTLSSPFTISATATSQLPVSFTSSNTAVATVSGDEITIVGNGTTTITAVQSGDENYNAAPPVDQILFVKPGQTITFDALSPKIIDETPFTISATASSGLPVIFSSTNPEVASVSGNTITINAIGTTAIIASQPGDETYLEAKDVTRLLIVTNIDLPANEQGQIWGMISDGGNGNLGLIYKTNGDGTGYAVVKEFKADADGASPSGTLTLASNGKFYGISYEGGLNNGGVIFEYDPATSAYVKKFDFKAFAYPVTELAANDNGKLYGMVQQGIQDISGAAIFEYDIASNSITQKQSLSEIGNSPSGKLLIAPTGKIYGLTRYNGAEGAGLVFEYDPAANSVVKKADFTTAIGANPVQLIATSDGRIYGTAFSGGANNDGVIFEFDPVNNSLTKKFDFAFAVSGVHPQGLLASADGKLYGMTVGGGANDVGIIYEFDPSTNSFTKKYDFISVVGDNQGIPGGRLLEVNGKLYGSDYGALFEFDPSNNQYTKKVLLSPATGNTISGSLSLYDGKLYGLRHSGGSGNAGVLFEYDYAADTYNEKHEFTFAPEGVRPQGSLTQASNGKLYGVTRSGGATNEGVIFEIDPATDTYVKRADFSGSVTGANPQASLLLGVNGKLYGATMGGSAGRLFEFDPATYSLKPLTYFGIEKGLGMQAKLIQTEDGKLWGVTSAGGISFPQSGGVLFEYDPATDTYNKKTDLVSETGVKPLGGLTLVSNGKLYGLTAEGGADGEGVLFEYDRSSNVYSKKFDFSSDAGTKPHATLIEVNGKLYGMTYEGGASNGGVLFEYDPVTSSYMTKHDFVSSSGVNPKGSLLLAANGKLYGTTLYGGDDGRGVIFEFDVATGTYIVRKDFAELTNPWLEITSLTQTWKAIRRDQTIAIDEIPSKNIGDASFSVDASATSALEVMLTTDSDKIIISGNTITLLKAGSVTLNANQPGNASFNPAPEAQRTFCINPARPAITSTGENTDDVRLNSSNPTGNQWYLNGSAIANATNSTYRAIDPGVYTVNTTIDNCSSELSDPVSLIITGFFERRESKIKMYPNPVTSQLIIELPGNSDAFTLQLLRPDGSVIRTTEASQGMVEWYLDGLSAGLYIARVKHPGKTEHHKLIKR